MRPMIAVLAALFCAGVFASDVYKWVDKDGKVHYGDRPKHEAQAVDVRPPGGPTDPEAEKADTERKATCDRKKAELARYREATVIQETDALGRTREYTDEERKLFLAKLEEQVKGACAPAQAEAE